ncbi:hypothetical protein PHPI107946_03395 [Phocicoccus pinnipedialis]|uniref:Uncharacterized protein n=1 Tax=Phocicoccus pinnipedialis TaxID=110845 RepID=A0A6V7R4L7_9BACL|nr:hypothetical protein [Jeotgalicoccus pinnipedialis]CAD2072321.1 hypothetical protein JEOPIN946_00419 [Jeotgalicoccus pinnipedialis]
MKKIVYVAFLTILIGVGTVSSESVFDCECPDFIW